MYIKKKDKLKLIDMLNELKFIKMEGKRPARQIAKINKYIALLYGVKKYKELPPKSNAKIVDLFFDEPT